MRFFTLTGASAANSVWAQGTRTLTSFGVLMSNGGAGYTTLAAAATLDLVPGASTSRDISVAIQGNTTALIQFWDGNSALTILSASASSTVYTTANGTNATRRLRLNNTGAGAAAYVYSFVDTFVG